MSGPASEDPHSVFRRVGGVWLALMGLLAVTVTATLLPIGPAKGLLSLAVSVAKAGLILWFFMQLRVREGLHRLAALAAAAWLVVLFGAVALDLLTRGPG